MCLLICTGSIPGTNEGYKPVQMSVFLVVLLHRKFTPPSPRQRCASSLPPSVDGLTSRTSLPLVSRCRRSVASSPPSARRAG
jgi:hypothetical protein